MAATGSTLSTPSSTAPYFLRSHEHRHYKPRPDAPAPRPEDEPIIKNVFFFPDITPADVRDVMRIEGTITAPRLRLAIKSAMAEVNAELFTLPP